MLTAGPISTSDDNPVDAIADTSALGARRDGRHVEIINSGPAAGFYSIDDGESWAYVPAEVGVIKDDVVLGNTVKLKRVAGGADLADVYVSVW